MSYWALPTNTKTQRAARQTAKVAYEAAHPLNEDGNASGRTSNGWRRQGQKQDMSTYHYETLIERQRREAWRAANPNAPLTSEERALLNQAKIDGEKEGATVVKQATQEVKEVIAETTPDHLKRPRNVPKELADQFDASPQFKDASLKAKIEDYRQRGVEEEARIDAMMVQKKVEYERSQDPLFQAAQAHLEKALAHADVADQPGWALAAGYLKAGAIKQFWDQSALLTGRARERTCAALEQSGPAVDAANHAHVKTLNKIAEIDALRNENPGL
jgi:hypothetical protein